MAWCSARSGLHRLTAWNSGRVTMETQRGREPDEDPDAGAATPPEEIERDAERDQAEGGEEPEEAVG